jgi:hypothetical protein
MPQAQNIFAFISSKNIMDVKVELLPEEASSVGVEWVCGFLKT